MREREGKHAVTWRRSPGFGAEGIEPQRAQSARRFLARYVVTASICRWRCWNASLGIPGSRRCAQINDESDQGTQNDETEDEITWGPQFSGAGAAPRDDSFNTQIGMVISNMRQFHRQIAPRFSKLIYQWYPDFQKNIEIIWDAHQYFQGNSKYLEYKGMRGAGASIEGGDIQPIDEETLLCGVGLRSNIWGFQTFLKKIFEADREERIKKAPVP